MFVVLKADPLRPLTSLTPVASAPAYETAVGLALAAARREASALTEKAGGGDAPADATAHAYYVRQRSPGGDASGGWVFADTPDTVMEPFELVERITRTVPAGYFTSARTEVEERIASLYVLSDFSLFPSAKGPTSPPPPPPLVTTQPGLLPPTVLASAAAAGRMAPPRMQAAQAGVMRELASYLRLRNGDSSDDDSSDDDSLPSLVILD